MARQTIQNSNASLYFNGVAYADTASNSTLSLANGFTVAGWIKISKFITASTRQKMIATANWGFGATSTTQKLSFTTIGVKDYDSTGSSIQPGTWVFACAVLDSSNDVTFYLNGQPDSVVTGTNPATTTAGVTSLGQRPTPTDRHIGNLSGVRVFNRELTAQEILSLYNGTVPSGVIAEYLLTEGAGTVAYDTSGNGNNGTITSGTWTRDTPTKTRKLVNNNLVYNGDFEIAPPAATNVATTTGGRYVDGTAGGSAPSAQSVFGWIMWNYIGSYAAQFDYSVKRDGIASMKISTTATASTVGLRVSIHNDPSFKHNNIPVLPSTSYTASGWVKTSLISGSATTGARLRFATSTGTGDVTTVDAVASIVTTTDWTQYSVTFTTAATARFITPVLQILGNDGAGTLIMDAWFADIQLYPTTPITRSANTLARQPVDELVYNGDFEYAPAFTAATTTASRWIDGTAGGTTIPSPYKWALSYTSGSGFAASFDTTEKYSGSYSMKVSTTATNSAVAAANAIATTNIPLYQLIRVSPSTSYSVTFRMKTTAISGSANGAYLRVNQYDQSGAFVSVALTTTQINTTTGWTEYTYTFTTAASGSFLNVLCAISGNTGATTLIMDAWFDNISLKLTTPTGRSAA